MTNFYIHFIYEIKRTMLAKFCIQNVYKKLSKCSKHFVYINFAYIWKQMFLELQDTFCIQTFCIHFVYILHTKCIQKFVEMWYTFCIHFLYNFIHHLSTSCTIFASECINSFRVGINDLSCRLLWTTTLFAYDTSLFSVVHDVTQSTNELNDDLEKIWNWAYGKCPLILINLNKPRRLYFFVKLRE